MIAARVGAELEKTPEGRSMAPSLEQAGHRPVIRPYSLSRNE